MTLEEFLAQAGARLASVIDTKSSDKGTSCSVLVMVRVTKNGEEGFVMAASSGKSKDYDIAVTDLDNMLDEARKQIRSGPARVMDI